MHRTRKTVKRKALALQVILALAAGPPCPGLDWPGWRGPEQSGASRELDLPETWSPDGENLIWSQPYGARSTPVVLLGRLYLVNVAGEGEKRQERILCLDAATGKLHWEHRFNVFLTDIPAPRVGWANPAADPETGYVYVHGVQGLLKCLDRGGKVIWERSLTEEFGRISGYGGRTQTPIVDEDRVVISFLNSSWGSHGRGIHRYLALDKRTGAVVWWSEPGGRPLDTTYSCPVISVIGGMRLLIAGNADGAIYALKSRTGERVWRFGLSKRGINSSVVEQGGLVYACHSEENIDTTSMGRVVCIDAAGRGDITETGEKWRADGLTVGYSTPALAGDSLYAVDNSANVYCFDAGTGTRRWKYNVGTVMKASPVVADGKMYLGAVTGTFSILKLGPDGATELSRQEFETPDGRPLEINGSACVSNGRVYFTTSKAIYCIGKKQWKDEVEPAPPAPREAPVEPSAAPEHLQIVPGDVTLFPGQSAFFKARLFDGGGRLLRDGSPTWSLRELAGEISRDGRLEIPASSGFQAGLVEARFGDLTARARVRVVPPLPIEVDFEDIPEGGVPRAWIGATPAKFRVVTRDGTKALKKLADKPRFLDAEIYLGLPNWDEYTLQADVLGTETRRNMPNIGILVNRYNLSLWGNHQRVRLVSWAPMPRIERKVNFPWKPDAWYRMKLRVDRQGEQAVVRGKVWPREEEEPEEWTVTMEDPSPNWHGSPGLHGYSAGSTDRSPGAEIYWDNIVVTPND